MAPSTTSTSSTRHSVACGRHAPDRYGWSSSVGERPPQVVDLEGGHAGAPSTMSEQVVAVLPPMLRVPTRVAPPTWVAPAVPVTWRRASTAMRTPVAPTGWPPPMSPPPGLTGMRPVRSMSPDSMAFHDSPGPVIPVWSMAR